MPNQPSPGSGQANTDSLAALVRRDLTNNEIADLLLASRTRLAPTIDAIRADLDAASVHPPAKRGSWGYRRG
mgnify:FL=1